MSQSFPRHEPYEFVSLHLNYTEAYQILQVGAYSDLFAYECCLVFGLALGLYLNLWIIRYFRFHLMFIFEAIAMALGVSGFHAFTSANETPTRIGYAALVLIIVNLAFGLIDMILRYRNRAMHTLHLLVSNAALWVGCIATTAWYRDGLRQNGYNDIWVFSFICMWGGAMIALPVPGTLNYLLFYEGPYNPEWVAVDPAERYKREDKARKKSEKEKEKKEKEEAREKTKKEKENKPEETEMVPNDKDFVTVRIHTKDKENGDDESDEDSNERRRKNKKKRSRDKDRDSDRDSDRKQKKKR